MRSCIALAALAICVAGCDGSSRASAKVDSTLSQARAALVARNYGTAADLARDAVAEAPDDPSAHFELARAQALLGNNGDAITELGRAVDKGLSDAPRALSDPAFEGLRGDPAFDALQERASPRKADAGRETHEPTVEIRSENGHDTVKAGDVVIDDDDF